MKTRCLNPNSKDFLRYQGRGITICERWKSSFWNFIEDMGPRPSPSHSIDRIDNNGNYEPSNCRWATLSDQANNMRSNHLVEYDGKSQSLAAWSAETGLAHSTLTERLRMGWTIKDALTRPLEKHGRTTCEIEGCMSKHLAKGYCTNHYAQLVTRPRHRQRKQLNATMRNAT